MRVCLAALQLAAFTPVSAPAEEHHAASVAEFNKVIALAKPGDTVFLAAGEWKDADLVVTAQGTADLPVTVQARALGKTVITGRSRLRFAGNHLVVSGLFFKGAWHKEDLIEFRRDSKKLAHDCRLTQCAVVDCNAPENKETRWIGLYGQRNRVDHCWVQGKTSKGTTLVVWLKGIPADHRIDHNHFGPRPELKQNGGETIRVGDSKTSMQLSRTVVEANCFERCDGEAEIISNKSCGNIYRGNTFRSCAGSLTLRHGNDCLVTGNFFFGEHAKGTGGVRVIGERHRIMGNYFQDLAGDEARAGLCLVNGLQDSPLNGYFQVRGAEVTGNSWVNCKLPVFIGQTDEDEGNSLPVQGVVLSRNLFSGRTAAVKTALAGDVIWKENIVQPDAAPQPAINGLKVVEFVLKGEPVRLPPADSPAAGHGFALSDGAQGPLLPSQTGPEWR
jgi:poly(beta-D-mannuronate) lyase